MKLKDSFKEILTSLLEQVGLAWWIEIRTAAPRCTYYFGPYANQGEAQAAQAGFVEDLEGEAAQGITCQVRQCKPLHLTVDEGSNGLPPVGAVSIP